jgi:hypothetical protein
VCPQIGAIPCTDSGLRRHDGPAAAPRTPPAAVGWGDVRRMVIRRTTATRSTGPCGAVPMDHGGADRGRSGGRSGPRAETRSGQREASLPAPRGLAPGARLRLVLWRTIRRRALTGWRRRSPDGGHSLGGQRAQTPRRASSRASDPAGRRRLGRRSSDGHAPDQRHRGPRPGDRGRGAAAGDRGRGAAAASSVAPDRRATGGRAGCLAPRGGTPRRARSGTALRGGTPRPRGRTLLDSPIYRARSTRKGRT